MCGIAGLIGCTDAEKAGLAVAGMRAALAHRGPDGDGTWSDPQAGVVLGHRRLSIIDLSHAADQPMRSADGRFVIAFNGEIYNYRELREECRELGSRFVTQSDTEVIYEAYRHWGPAAFARFKGMWAFALYDTLAREVVFCRDPFGIKPLYYGFLDGMLYFGSEPKALRAADARFSEPDAVTEHLFLESAYLERGDWTFFRRMRRFPHAHYAVWKIGASSTLDFRRYWRAPDTPAKIGYSDAAERLLSLLRSSVELHLRSDVPVGSCLSGGIDSSAIVCLGSELLPEGRKFTTFTTRYPEHPEIDESKWAKRVIEFADADAHFIEPRFENFKADFDRLVWSQDEPFGSTSIYAQYAIFQGIARTPVRVVLDGQGADEQLAGYHGFVPIYLDSLLAQGRALTYVREVIALRKAGAGQPFKRRAFWKALRQRPARPRGWNTEPFKTWFADELEERLRLLSLPSDSFEQTLVNLVVETNLTQLLRYEDRNSMAHSIESRVPFLEPELVSFVLALPAEYKIRGGWTKAVLRDALKGVIPDDVRLRRDKLGFPAPELQWLKRGFGIEPAGIGSRQWRDLVAARWRAGIEEGTNGVS